MSLLNCILLSERPRIGFGAPPGQTPAANRLGYPPEHRTSEASRRNSLQLGRIAAGDLGGLRHAGHGKRLLNGATLQEAQPATDLPPELSGSRTAQIQFGSLPFMSVPAWAQWLIDVGRAWALGERRSIALLSMPCDSPAAGLVAFGALSGGLADPRASDVAGHFDELIRYARQYLEACRHCEMRCQPRERRCGYTSEATGKLRHVSGGQLGTILDFQGGASPEIRLGLRSGTILLYPAAGQSYYVHRAPPIVARSEDALDPAAYEDLAGDAGTDPANLRRTYSGTCLAGRAAGESATRTWYDSVRIRTRGQELPLSGLLTIRSWGAQGVSRMTFFNTRTGQFDRHSSFNRLVIADGSAALEKVLATREFDRSDVIGVVHRTGLDDAGRSLGERLAAMSQWYSSDDTPLLAGRQTPRGIAVHIIRQSR